MKKYARKKMRIALKNIRKRGELTVSKFRTRTSLCSCLSLNSLLRDVKQKKKKQLYNKTIQVVVAWLVSWFQLSSSLDTI
jgi:hypothetical protein